MSNLGGIWGQSGNFEHSSVGNVQLLPAPNLPVTLLRQTVIYFFYRKITYKYCKA